MRILAFITALVLFLFLEASVPAFSQANDRPDHPQEEKSKDQSARDKDQSGSQRDNAGRQDQGMQNETRPENREHPEAARPQEQSQPEQRHDEHARRPEDQMHSQEKPRRDERGNRKQGVEGEQGRPIQGQRGQRIPEDRFRANFGREHQFHVQPAQIVNRPQPEFVYAGYTFELADPWPSEWSFDDDCYIDYIDDQYYLFNAFHPGIRVLIFVIG